MDLDTPATCKKRVDGFGNIETFFCNKFSFTDSVGGVNLEILELRYPEIYRSFPLIANPIGPFNPVTTSIGVGEVAVISILEILFALFSATYRSFPWSANPARAPNPITTFVSCAFKFVMLIKRNAVTK
ncbi:MAG: hypothetical protein ACWIPJ_10270 [Polaribacter sp.]